MNNSCRFLSLKLSLRTGCVRLRLIHRFLLVVGCIFVTECRLPAAERYAAMFSDGSRVEEAEVREWCDPAKSATVATKPLFDAANPVRWIIDRKQPVGTDPVAFLEFHGGDRFSGEVVAFRANSGSPYEALPPHLIVKPAADMQPPDDPQPSDVRVTMAWLRRVVWQRVAGDELRPGSVWLRNGGMLAYRSLRWSEGSVVLLTADGVKELSFADVGEIHLPKSDPWSCYYDQLAVLTPQLTSRLLQCETSDGSRITTSLDRFRPRFHGDRNRPEQWYHLVQPAWSLDALWLRYRSIRTWRSYAPTDVPLTNFVPVDVKEQAVFGTSWHWQTNRNVQGGMLQSAKLEFGWGFGAHASCDLIFEYPETAVSFRTQAGIDAASGAGGCVHLVTLLGPNPANQHQFVVSATPVVDTSWITLPAVPADRRRFTLRADMAHEGRPATADPFDVRDAVNWYEPELKLNPTTLAAQVRSRVISVTYGLSDWTFLPGEVERLEIATMLDATNPRDPVFRPVVRTLDKFLLASRSVKVGAQDRWLSLVISRFADPAFPTTPSSVQVRINDKTVGDYDIPQRTTIADPEPILIPINAHQGQSITVDLVCFPTDDKSYVDWRGLAVTPERPGVLPIFEDDPKFAALLGHGTGSVSTTDDKPYSGKLSLSVTPDAGDAASLPGLDAMIVDNPKLGQFRYVVFAWKQPTGTKIQLQFANQGRLGAAIAQQMLRADQQRGRPARPFHGGRGIAEDRGLRHGYAYDAGTDQKSAGAALRLDRTLPKEWQFIARDIYGDFGTFNVTGVSLGCVDGDAAYFDHLYFARTPADMELLRTHLVNPQPVKAVDPSVIDFAVLRPDYGRVMASITSHFSTMEQPHGLYRMKEHLGHIDAVRSYPIDQNKPVIFRHGLVLPKDRPKVIDLKVSHLAASDWLLIVKANGEVIHQQLIDEKLTQPQKGFASITVPLSKYAGQKVLLEILNQSNNWSNEYAFWKRMELRDE